MLFQHNKQETTGDWYVPVSKAMVPNGVNDANKKIFQTNSPLKSIIRENIQNSLDAKEDGKDFVQIEISLESINTKDFPEKKNFERYINKIKNSKRWKKDSDIYELVKTAKNALNADKMPVLRFSDYNTTGAEGALNYQAEYSNPWNLLTATNNATGNSSSSGSGGSFGVGKNASKVCSDLSTVFYTTKTKESDKDFSLGSSTLASYIDSDGNISGNIYTYALEDDKKPIPSQLLKLDSGYERTTKGTDVFIMAFNELDDLRKNAEQYILSEFLVSIFLNKLSVKIKLNDTEMEINKKNLYSIVEKLAGNSDDESLHIKNYFSALNEGKVGRLSENYRDYFDLGKDDGLLYLLNRQNSIDTSTSTFLMTRENGMKIFERNFNGVQRISGVFIAQGKLSMLLRRMEDVTHTRWDPNNFRKSNTDKKRVPAKKLYSDLMKNIRTFIKESTVDEEEDSIFDNLMNDFIYIPQGTQDTDNDDEEEAEINNHISSVDITRVGVKKTKSKPKSSRKVVVTSESGESKEPTDKTPTEDKAKTDKPKRTYWSEISPKSDFLIPSNENTLNYVFESSAKLPRTMLVATIIGETQQEAPNIVKATYNGKSLKFKTNGKSAQIFIDDEIKRSETAKISLTVKDGSDIGLQLQVLKEVEK